MSWKDDGNFSTLEDIQAYGDARAEAERERIIALLEAEHSEWTAQHQENKRVYIDDCSACFAIDLIKGGQK